jgi:KaiC/GvpD/RAD55 family RecA-like ATPase
MFTDGMDSGNHAPAATERISTGIKGLDDLLFGGIPKNNQVLLGGGPGAGKTLMSFEILYHNAKAGVPCAFISLEETQESILKNSKAAFPEFTDIDALMASKALVFGGSGAAERLEESDAGAHFGGIISEIEEIIEASNAKLIAIDSASLLRMLLSDVTQYRKAMVYLMSALHRLNVTSIVTVEIPSPERSEMRFTPEFFVFDGIITMYEIVQQEKRQPSIEILKMRGTEHSWSTAPYEITPKGFRVFTLEQD